MEAFIKLKQIDFIFIVFLLLVTQGNIQLKLVGILFILLLRPNAILKINGLAKFYILIILLHVCSGIINFIINGVGYFINFMMVFVFWTISFIIISQINYFLKLKTIEVINATINLFFIISVLFVLYQYLSLSFDYWAINPYSISPAAGDNMKSIYSNSSVNMIVMSFFLLSYAFRTKWVFALFSLICLLMCTYMSGTVIFLVGILFSVLFFSKIKRKYKVYLVGASLISIVIFSSVSPSNVNYAMGYINRIMENEDRVPYKIKSFWQTIDYNSSSVKSLFIGAGGGNFSSRVAFMGSGDYVDWFPKTLSYSSDEFIKNHLGIWNHDFNNKWDDKNNTANQPFSFYNQIMGEYGLVGVLIFLLFYLGYVAKNWNILTYSKFAMACLLGYFLLDYWFEYFSVMVIFELLLMLDIKLNSKEEKENMNAKEIMR
ncbi:hypothetical protein BZARG_1638 [Bizionia argentinensis JUB59]|uniref:O-antigen ligase domain-containing protein n=1 Tax=Bizionia argentinensis JUB59 TaxID=1046627 RepID=G2EES4_9FLAO|nr:membrane protein [Bizionia argentinensis]EGV43075.1 hypothetical protein BZARG_1638 [Bizionia argentinensis JUB59]